MTWRRFRTLALGLLIVDSRIHRHFKPASEPTPNPTEVTE